MPVVGVGVCAASLGSLDELFAGVGAGNGGAWLIAVRQKEGLSVDTVLDLLRRKSSLPVKIASSGDSIEPDHIYVGGPDDMITLEDGHIHVRPAIEPVGHRGTIDSMLISLAEHAQERAVAVLLAGLGTDGTAGITATKKFGGLSIAERVEGEDATTQEGVGAFGVVDQLLPVNAIASQIAQYTRNIASLAERGDAYDGAVEIEAQITQITTILRNVTGNDFHGYKRGTFIRRVNRRMQVTQIDSVTAYLTRLREDREEVQHLFQDLLISVTQFFRDPQEFEVLEREIPRLFEGKEAGEQLRVWVLGCATGEEAYSIAILLREHMAKLDNPPDAQIFATDLDARALNLARAGRYTDAIADQVRSDRLERWFVREGDTYCVSKELREMCIFSPHNIVKDAPFSRIDVLSCRNLLIYLNAEIQSRVIPIFHFSLRPGGVLFLGSSENVTRHQRLFAPVDRKNRVFRRLETAARIIPDFPLSTRVRSPEPQHLPSLPAMHEGRLTLRMSRQAEAIAERYAPAYVVVDAQYDVLHFSGRTGRYLEPSAGAATLNLMSLVHRDLRSDVRSALSRAASDGQRVELAGLTIHDDDRTRGVNLVVEPVDGSSSTLVVLFQDIGPVHEAGGAESGRFAGDDHVQRVEAELRITRDRLQATIEELESTNEELKSSNEEYQSINEELQSASEEMETSKEELQSVNEELQTVNGELSHRVLEIGRTNSDLKNLLESTQIATVFLDNDLRVRNFTPVATEIFHLLETDIGRPLDHVVSRVHYPELLDDVRRVLKTLTPIEREIVDRHADRYYAARVLPYRSTDNYISGAVVTFTDLTAVHRAESAMRDSEQRYRAFVTASSDAIYRMNSDWSEMWEMDGREFLPSTTSPSQDWMETYIHPDEQQWVRARIDEAVRLKNVFELEHRIYRADSTIGWTHSRAVPILDDDGVIVEWLGAASDVTAAHESEAMRRASDERLRSAIEVARVGTWDWDVATGEINWSDEHFRMNGYAVGEVSPSHEAWVSRIHPEDREAAEAALRNARETHQEYVHEFRSLHPNGSVHWLSARGRFLYRDDGTPVRMIGAMVETTDAREFLQRQEVLVAELQHRTRNLIGVVRSMAEKTMRRAGSLEDFRERFRERLGALARVQGLLSRLDEHDRVSFDELIHTELAAHGVSEDGDERVSLQGPEGIRLRSSMVQTLALGLHELATNASKYGALRDSGGHLNINWRMINDAAGDQRLEIVWKEEGVDMAAAGTIRGTGQGRELIERALPYQLDAKTSYVMEPDGVRCVIDIPVSRTTL
nr:CheR family methyltransferase [Sphingomonas xinjiangensis]